MRRTPTTESERSMSDPTTISANDIVTAVQNDPAINEASFDQLKNVVGELAQIIGDKHNTVVEFVPLCEITLALWKRLKETGCTYGVGSLLESQMEVFAMFEGHFEMMLTLEGVTEAEAMLSPEMGLNDEMRELYQSGKLTFGTLAQRQPSVFLT